MNFDVGLVVKFARVIPSKEIQIFEYLLNYDTNVEQYC